MHSHANRIRVVHIITSLTPGGAEMMLYKLIAHTNRHQFESIVIALDDKQGLAEKISAHGVSVHFLNMRNNLLSSWRILQLARLLRSLQPDVVQGWMYHGSLAASLANNVLSNRYPVLWNIRQSLYNIHQEKRSTQWVIRLAAKQSTQPERIIYNSWLSAEQHAINGFEDRRSQVIANGFDLRIFTAKPYHRESIRHELGIPRDALVIGMFAHYHPMKNHALFLEAAHLLCTQHQHIHFILAGNQLTQDNTDIQRLLKRYPASAKRLHLLGERRDIPALLNALDIFSLTSSHGEGFPNVIGEAMACSIPCIATDVGDTPRIIGRTGQILQDATPSSLAFAWLEWMNAGKVWRQEMGQQAMRRIHKHYNIRAITDQYQDLYQEVAARHHADHDPQASRASGNNRHSPFREDIHKRLQVSNQTA